VLSQSQNNVAAVSEQRALIRFSTSDLPEVPLAPALRFAEGSVPRHIQLSVMAHTRSLNSLHAKDASKGFFPNSRSQSYIPGQMSMSGIVIVGQGTVTINTTEDQSDARRETEVHEFSIPLCKYSRQIGTVSGKYTVSYSVAAQTSKSFRHSP
jgi:hypothetical protein